MTLSRCVFAGNSASNGGGLYNLSHDGGVGTMTLSGSTLTGNSAGSGGGLYNSAYNFTTGTATLTDDILYNDSGGEVYNNTAINLTYCDVQVATGTTYPGTANINAAPMFVRNPVVTNGILTDPGDLHLRVGSPCIGVGTPYPGNTTDINGTPRPTMPSIGAYEAAAATVSGTVSLQGVTAGNLALPMTFTLTPTGSTAGSAVTQTVTPAAADGSFTLLNVLPGTYTLGVKGITWLRRDVSIDTTAGNVSGLSIALLAGDLNGDNKVSLSDYIILNSNYNKQGDP